MQLEFIAKYWLQILFGIIASIIGTQWKKIKAKVQEYNKLRKEKQDENMRANMIEAMKPMLEELAAKSDHNDTELRNELGALQIQLGDVTTQLGKVTNGILNVQGNIFKRECKEMLKEGAHITQEQYDKCMSDHSVYNDLGGNHDGDQLFELVTEKYKHQL